MVGTGLVMGGLAENRATRERTEIGARRVALAENNARFDREQATREAINERISQTRSEIEKLTKFAVEARSKGADPTAVAKVRGLIEPLAKSLQTFPGGAQHAQLALNRFDAMVDAAPPADAGGAFTGTSIEAQTRNVLIGLSQKIQQGIPLTGAEKRAYSIAYADATKPRVVGSPTTGFSTVSPTVDPTLFPAPGQLGVSSAPEPRRAEADSGLPATGTAGATLQPSPTATSGGATVTPLSGPQAMKANEAGRVTLISEAAQTAFSVRDAIVNPDGSVNRDLIFSMNTDIPLLGSGIPGTEGRTIRAQLEDALAAKLRLETGAQANETELKSIIDRFTPTLFDSDATVADKMNRLTAFFEGALSRADPELFESLTARAREAGDIPEPPPDEAGAEFQGFDPSSGVAVFKRPDGTSFGIRGQNGGGR